jgi:structural maintenance of chromosome 3 (chondroitin sulfate proteoglycan 6)
MWTLTTRLSLDDGTARLQALYSKQGRITQFTTVAARDKFLNDEIKKIKALEQTQAKNAEELDGEVEGARRRLEDLANKSADVRQSLDDRKERLRELVDDLAKLKDEQLQLTERRK